MTMRLKRPNYTLNRVIVGVLFIMIASSLECKAIDNESEANALDSIITDINYTYELFDGNSGKLDCVGELSVSAEIPSDAKRLIFMRTIRTAHNPHFFMEKTVYDVNDGPIINISKSKIYWNTYFRIGVFYTDGHDEYTSTYSINDYIKSEDLQLLETQAGIEDTQDDSVSLTVQGRNIYVDTSDNINLSVFDIFGRELFCGHISESVTIPINSASSSVIIVKYIKSNIITTKKMIVK